MLISQQCFLKPLTLSHYVSTQTITMINNSGTFLSVFLFYFSRILENFSHLTFTCSGPYRVNNIFPFDLFLV